MTTSSISGVASSDLTVIAGEVLQVYSGGATVFTTVDNGGIETILAGGSVTSTTLSAGGIENVSSGGVATGTIVSGGEQIVFSSGTASLTQIAAGGIMTVSASGTASLATVDNSGLDYVLAGATVNGTTVMAGGDEFVFGGLASGSVVSAGGTQKVEFAGATASATIVHGLEYVIGGGSAVDLIVSSGGFDLTDTNGSVSGTTVWNGGFEFVDNAGQATSTTVNSGGLQVVSSGGTATDTVVNVGGGIDAAALAYAAGATAGVNGSDLLTISAGGQTYTQQLAGSYAGAVWAATSGTYGGTQVTLASTALCFLAGTRIATPDGEKPVEAMSVGDLVSTAGGGVRPVTWIGTGRVLAAPGRRDAATPAIVRKGALSGNVPYGDLRVTKGHSLLLDGVLIPVEFLVNHRSIYWDDRARAVSLYHVELDAHDVLLANGAPAESYRDDGNRWLFQNANTGWDRPPQPPCAPVLTGGPVVDAIWRRLLDRSGWRPGVPLTDNPDIHLRVDGVRVDPTERVGDFVVFGLRSVPVSVWLVSRAASPQELGLARDSRSLGVAVRRIRVCQGSLCREIGATDPLLADGFHDAEADHAFRWTNGMALLPAKLFADMNGPSDVIVQLGGMARYLDEGTATQAA